MSVNITSPENFAEQLKSEENKGKQVIVDFWATWCGPCRAVSPILDKIDNEDDNVTLLKVDVDANPELAAAFRVQSIPTLSFFKDGQANATPIIGVASQNAIQKHYQEA
jgi:thioredoxin 1